MRRTASCVPWSMISFLGAGGAGGAWVAAASFAGSGVICGGASAIDLLSALVWLEFESFAELSASPEIFAPRSFLLFLRPLTSRSGRTVGGAGAFAISVAAGAATAAV